MKNKILRGISVFFMTYLCIANGTCYGMDLTPQQKEQYSKLIEVTQQIHLETANKKHNTNITQETWDDFLSIEDLENKLKTARQENKEQEKIIKNLNDEIQKLKNTTKTKDSNYLDYMKKIKSKYDDEIFELKTTLHNTEIL